MYQIKNQSRLSVMDQTQYFTTSKSIVTDKKVVNSDLDEVKFSAETVSNTKGIPSTKIRATIRSRQLSNKLHRHQTLPLDTEPSQEISATPDKNAKGGEDHQSGDDNSSNKIVIKTSQFGSAVRPDENDNFLLSGSQVVTPTTKTQIDLPIKNILDKPYANLTENHMTKTASFKKRSFLEVPLRRDM